MKRHVEPLVLMKLTKLKPLFHFYSNNFFCLDVISQASSGRRSAAYSSHNERVARQSSVISERASVASGSLASSVLAAGDVGDTTHLTPQQLGVMGESFMSFTVMQ